MTDAARVLGHRVRARSGELAARWLTRLSELVPLSPSGLFPSTSSLDDIRALIDELGVFLANPRTNFAPSGTVVATTRRLGAMRLSRQSSVPQILREYDLLAEVLGAYMLEELPRIQPPAGYVEAGVCQRRMAGAVAVLAQLTVEAFTEGHAKRLSDQIRRLEEFSRLASHELRRPLSAIEGAVGLLRKVDARHPAPWVPPLDVIERNVVQLKELLDQISDLSRARTPGAARRQWRRVSLARAADDAVERLGPEAAQRGVTISVDPRLPQVTVDPARLEVILTNLLSNAVKYSDPAKPARLASVSLLQNGPPACVFEVRDNGLGMTPQQARNAFAPFYRGHADRDRELQNSGHGLGLAIVFECVHALDGDITVETAVSEGTAFRVTLPVACAQSAALC